MTVGGSYNMWNFLEWIRKGMEFARVINKKTIGVLFFGLGIFEGCYTLSLNHTCSDFRFFQNFQDKPRKFSGVFTKTFPQPPCLFFSGADHCQTDRPLVLGAEIPCPLHWPRNSSWTFPKQNLLQITSKKYTSFFCFPIICSSAIWKSLF